MKGKSPAQTSGCNLALTTRLLPAMAWIAPSARWCWR
jgi:hypothetical protein